MKYATAIAGLAGLLLALFAALAGLAAPALAAPQAVELPAGEGFVQPFESTRYLIDRQGRMTLADAMAAQDGFRPIPSRWIDFGEQEGRIWLQARVTNPGPGAGQWMLDLQRQWIDTLSVWKVPAGGSPQELLSLTGRSALAERAVKSRYIAVPLDMAPGETADIFVRYSSRTGSWLPLTFATHEAFRTAHMREERTNWALNGALLALIAVALALGRIAGWRLALAYCAYALAGGLLVANNEGYLFRFLWPGHAAIYDRANLALLAALVAAGLWFARSFTEFALRHPRLDRALRVFLALVLAIVPLAFALPDAGLLHWPVYALTALGAVAYLALAADAVRARVLGGLPFAVGAAALSLTLVFAGLVLAFPGEFALTVALDYIHATILIEGLAFLVAMVLRILRIREELNRALALELESAQERLRLSEELAESQRRYDETRRLAEQRRARLASASHDLQQPLIALRRSLGAIGTPGSEERGRAQAVLDYLEDLTSQGLAESRPEDMAGEAPDEGKESFPVALITANCEAMFKREAEAMGIALTGEAGEDLIHADPVVLMRIVSNLVSNALKHSGGSAVSIAARGEGDRVALVVRDDGKGMTQDELASLTQAYSKGEGSEGHGLGLHLVLTLCAEQGIGLTIESEPGEGTRFALSIAKGE